jgi:hypothetical protein
VDILDLEAFDHAGKQMPGSQTDNPTLETAALGKTSLPPLQSDDQTDRGEPTGSPPRAPPRELRRVLNGPIGEPRESNRPHAVLRENRACQLLPQDAEKSLIGSFA